MDTVNLAQAAVLDLQMSPFVGPSTHCSGRRGGMRASATSAFNREVGWGCGAAGGWHWAPEWTAGVEQVGWAKPSCAAMSGWRVFTLLVYCDRIAWKVQGLNSYFFWNVASLFCSNCLLMTHRSLNFLKETEGSRELHACFYLCYPTAEYKIRRRIYVNINMAFNGMVAYFFWLKHPG